MRAPRVDHAFRRYQETGDPAQLAIVFDATAQELFRLAWHLIGERHAAEDLVQSTFLAAIETARSFAPDCEVMPWLCGILANRARDARRRRRQQATAELPLRLDIVDPAQQAGSVEVSAVVGNAIRGLPEPYRQVLLLHLEHGLAGKQIAETLSRPEPTARSQIQRGLDLLRAALPPALTEAGDAPPQRHDLRKVRAAVLGSLGSAALVTTVGAFTMKKILVAAGSAAIALACAWPWLRPNAPTPTTTSSAAASPIGSAHAESSLAATKPSDRAPAESPTTSATSLDVLVRWSDGQPASDVVVWHVPSVPRSQLSQRTATTDANGHARFAAVAPGDAMVCGDRGGELQTNVLPQRLTSLVLDLERGLDVSGRVVDERARPVAGAEIWLAAPSTDAVVVAKSDADGSFALRAVAENSRLAAAAEGLRASRGVKVVANAEGRCECTLPLEPGSNVEGTVLDLQGRPVAGATLLCDWLGMVQLANLPDGERPEDFRPVRLHRTDARGNFRAVGLPRGQLLAWAGSPQHAVWFGTIDTTAIVSPLTIALGPGATVRGRITDRLGRPVADGDLTGKAAIARQRQFTDWGHPAWAFPQASSDGEGRFELQHVTAGSNNLQATWNGNHCAVTMTLADQEEATWNPQFGIGPRFVGVLVDPTGTSLGAWNVQVRGELNNQGRTDALGQFAIEVPDGVYELWFIPPGVDVGAWRIADQRPQPDPMRIVIPADRIPSSRVSGELRRPDGTAAVSCPIDLAHLGADGTTRGFRCTTDAVSGRFTSGQLFPGRYLLHATAAGLGTLRTKSFDVRAGETFDLGTLHFAEPGRLSVRMVLPEGLALPKMLVFRADGEAEAMLASLDGDTATMPAVQPGTYFVSTWNRTPACTLRVEVSSGAPTAVVMQVPNGVPCFLQYPPIACDDYLLHIVFRDATGAITYECGGRNDRREVGSHMPLTIAAGRYSITVADASGRSATTTADIQAAEPPMVVTLPSPPGL